MSNHGYASRYMTVVRRVSGVCNAGCAEDFARATNGTTRCSDYLLARILNHECLRVLFNSGVTNGAFTCSLRVLAGWGQWLSFVTRAGPLFAIQPRGDILLFKAWGSAHALLVKPNILCETRNRPTRLRLDRNSCYPHPSEHLSIKV